MSRHCRHISVTVQPNPPALRTSRSLLVGATTPLALQSTLVRKANYVRLASRDLSPVTKITHPFLVGYCVKNDTNTGDRAYARREDLEEALLLVADDSALVRRLKVGGGSHTVLAQRATRFMVGVKIKDRLVNPVDE